MQASSAWGILLLEIRMPEEKSGLFPLNRREEE
jgi:hypothetical protein